MKKIIITGSSGMVGKAVLFECLENENIESVLIINRSSIHFSHPKLVEIILVDFMQLEAHKDKLIGYDACFYCMGISALGINEATYRKITYDTTKIFVDLLFDLNPQMVFNYVSGEGTDSTEKGKVMWARIKGKTENMVLNKGFKDAYCIRLGAIIPEKGIQSRTRLYRNMYTIFRPFFGFLKKSKNITTTTKFGKAMINTLLFPTNNKYLKNVDLNNLALK